MSSSDPQGVVRHADRVVDVGDVYDELRTLAAAQLRRLSPGETLNATGLVHEAWLRLESSSAPRWTSRRQFFGAAARAMRNLLVDAARRSTHRPERLACAFDPVALESTSADLVDVDGAISRLAAIRPGAAEVVELRVFCGLSHPEVARVTSRSLRMVEREWRFARAWLQSDLEGAAE